MRTFLALAWLALAGCGVQAPGAREGAPVAGGERSRSAQSKPAAEEAAAPDYRVDVEAPTNVPAGQPVVAKVHVRPTAPWHMNLDYPAKLSIGEVSGVDLDTLLLRKADAERLDDAELVFPVLFTPKPGHRGPTRIAGELHFAICGAAECAPIRVPIEFSLEVT